MGRLRQFLDGWSDFGAAGRRTYLSLMAPTMGVIGVIALVLGHVGGGLALLAFALVMLEMLREDRDSAVGRAWTRFVGRGRE